MKTKKGNVAAITLIIVIVAITFGVIVFLFMKKLQTPDAPAVTTQQPAQPVDKIANWQTYKDTKNGFEVKYPQSYTIDNTKDGVVVIKSSTSKLYEYALNIQINQDPSLKSLDLEAVIQSLLNSYSISEPQKITLAGQAAYEGNDNGLTTEYAIWVKKGNNLYELLFGVANKDSLTENRAALDADQKLMLSTFKFTDVADETLNWQTYTNSKYGYSIKYPSGWFSYVDNTSDVFFQPDKEIPGGIPGSHADAFEIAVTKTNKTADAEIDAEGKQAGIQFNKTNVKIGGLDGIRAVSNCEGVGCGVPDWFLVTNGNLYHFSSNLGYTNEFDQILSTLKFTN